MNPTVKDTAPSKGEAATPRASDAVDQKATQPSPENRIRIAPGSIVLFGIVFWTLPLLGLFFTRFITILLIIFLSVLFSTFLSPLVDGLQRLRLHRGIAILLIYLALLGILALVGRLAVPLFVDETQRLLATLPGDLERVAAPLRRLGINVPTIGQGHGVNIKNLINSLLTSGGHQITGIAGQAVGLAFTVGTFFVCNWLAGE